MTFYECMTELLDYEARKHDLGCDYAERRINQMSNDELLQHISMCLEHTGYTFNREES